MMHRFGHEAASTEMDPPLARGPGIELRVQASAAAVLRLLLARTSAGIGEGAQLGANRSHENSSRVRSTNLHESVWVL
jgi:hypothetical protein